MRAGSGLRAMAFGSIALVVAAGVAAAAYVYDILGDTVSRDEVARATSPSGAHDAVLHETNGGATTSFGYEVRIVAKGALTADGPAAAALYGARRNNSAYGVNLRWRDKQTLAVEYLDARSTLLEQGSVVAPGGTVTVVLQGGVSDPLAPPGGMLHNLSAGQASGAGH